ncbi:MAG: redoxin domain-containing protein [Solirubrobacteraceae bacterium]|jgi:peroxiredoxin (alkyl hydroperoxide reductase subunit C)|nr:redoxin domain-containing protein [Solirubrobacteraceae bacterium]
MAVLAPGAPAPEFSLQREDGEAFTRADLAGRTVVLVFYPFAFSPVCTDQLQVYEEALGEITADGAEIYGVSCDAPYSQTAFREKLGVTIPQLSDFEPKGEASRAFGAFFAPGGMATRALVVLKDGVVAWSWEGEHPGVLPGVNLVFDGLQAAASA